MVSGLIGYHIRPNCHESKELDLHSRLIPPAHGRKRGPDFQGRHLRQRRVLIDDAGLFNEAAGG